MTTYAHLTFNGNCRKAMTFYQRCFGGELVLQSVSNSAGANALPLRARKCILQATLRKNGLLLVGTDMVGEEGLIKGNAVSMLLHCQTMKDARLLYQRLARGGRIRQALQTNYLGVAMGGVTDKYGYHWIVTT